MANLLRPTTITSKVNTSLSIKPARAFVHTLGLTGEQRWREYCLSGNKPDDIPQKPERTYDGKGWDGWPDWLGYVPYSRWKIRV